MGNHRADRRAPRPVVSAARVQGGRRKATRPARHPLTGHLLSAASLSRLPLAPSVAGAIAISVAAVGAVTAGITEASANATEGAAAVQAPSFAQFDTPGINHTLDSRQRAISRDSERDAQRDAANQELVKATEVRARQQQAALSSLAKSAEKQATKLAKNLWVLPTTGYHLTARFGMAGGLWSSNHTGLDFAAPSGTPIVAIANGTITETGYDGSYGNRTVETLEDGTEIWYAHQSVIGAHVGDVVTGGEQIGNIGTTGNTTGPHVHIEVRPGGGDPVDPYTAMVYHGLHP